MIVDALIFIASEIFGFFFIFYYLIVSIGKAFLLLFRPLLFLFSYIINFIAALLQGSPDAATIIDPNVLNFFASIPLFTTLTSFIGLSLMVWVTIKILIHDKRR